MSVVIQTDPPRPVGESLPTMCDLPNAEIEESALTAEQEPQPAEQEYQHVERLIEMLRRLGQDAEQPG
jgi:hypothetical protein